MALNSRCQCRKKCTGRTGADSLCSIKFRKPMLHPRSWCFLVHACPTRMLNRESRMLHEDSQTWQEEKMRQVTREKEGQRRQSLMVMTMRLQPEPVFQAAVSLALLSSVAKTAGYPYLSRIASSRQHEHLYILRKLQETKPNSAGAACDFICKFMK